MTDLSMTIAPKSNQLNADDLITGPITVTITNVSAAPGEQPIAINYEGDNGKPYYPCKIMRRLFVHVWGPNGKSYIGHSMTLYRDPKVLFGGIAVGGIRISHVSHIEKPITLALSESRTKKTVFTVQPLKVATDRSVEVASALVARANAAESLAAMKIITGDEMVIKQRTFLTAKRPELAQLVNNAVSAKLLSFEKEQIPVRVSSEEMDWIDAELAG